MMLNSDNDVEHALDILEIEYYGHRLVLAKYRPSINDNWSSIKFNAFSEVNIKDGGDFLCFIKTTIVVDIPDKTEDSLMLSMISSHQSHILEPKGV